MTKDLARSQQSEDLILTASNIAVFKTCPLAAWARFFLDDGIARKRKTSNYNSIATSNFYLLKGQLLHEAIANFLDFARYKTSPKLADLISIYKALCDRLDSSLRGEVFEVGMRSLETFYSYFYKHKKYGIRDAFSESKKSCQLHHRSGFSVQLSGKIDCLNFHDDGADIIDWKFRSRVPETLSSTDYWQLLAYAYLVSKEYSSVKTNNLINFYITPNEVIERRFVYDETSDRDIEKTIEEIIDKSLSNHRKPEKWNAKPSSQCFSCPMMSKGLCPSVGGKLPSHLEIARMPGAKNWSGINSARKTKSKQLELLDGIAL